MDLLSEINLFLDVSPRGYWNSKWYHGWLLAAHVHPRLYESYLPLAELSHRLWCLVVPLLVLVDLVGCCHSLVYELVKLAFVINDAYQLLLDRLRIYRVCLALVLIVDHSRLGILDLRFVHLWFV